MSNPETLGLVCWGSGQFGQHGHAIDEPVPIAEGLIKRFDSNAKVVGCGASHTIVVTKSNEVFGWGNGQNGQLGCGDTVQHLSPTRMKIKSADGVDGDTVIVDVACGDRHTCLLLADGRVLCCGSNFYAQLSYDHMRPRYREDMILPAVMPLPRRVTQIACGQYHTVMLYESKEVACMGRNMYGQIGAPSENAKYDCFEKPKLLQNTFDHAIVRIATGSNHSLCIDEKGDAYCWGYGRACGVRQGHVGTPTQLRCHQRRIVNIDGGSSHTALLTESGQVLMLGSNSDGQCGLGPGIHFINNPTQIPPEHFHQHRVIDLVCGEHYTAACNTVNQLFLWGKNSHVISSEPIDCRYYEPVIVNKVHKVERLVCGTWHAAALVSEMSARPDQECNGNTSEAPSLMSESSAECLQGMVSSESEEEEDSHENADIPTVTMIPPTGIGIERERTRITLAELYAPTPTPRVHHDTIVPSDDDEEEADAVDSPSSSHSVVPASDPGQSGRLRVECPHVWTSDLNGVNCQLSAHELSTRGAWTTQSVTASNPSAIASSDLAVDRNRLVVTNAFSAPNHDNACLPSDSSTCSSERTCSPPLIYLSVSPNGNANPTPRSKRTPRVVRFAVEPSRSASPPLESSPPLEVVRVPSPIANKPPVISKVSLKRESLTPLNLNGSSHRRSVSEDVYVLRSGAKMPVFSRRMSGESESQRRLHAPLNRRSSHNCVENSAMPDSAQPQPSLVRERSLMVPRTLTFVLNERRELTMNKNTSAVSDTSSPKTNVSVRNAVSRPAVVVRRQGARANPPSLRRSNTTVPRNTSK